jgi:hypothetical protein
MYKPAPVDASLMTMGELREYNEHMYLKDRAIARGFPVLVKIEQEKVQAIIAQARQRKEDRLRLPILRNEIWKAPNKSVFDQFLDEFAEIIRRLP